jgi:putative CocE/NonD family hydrolase
VQLQIRRPDGFVERHENEWPIARTQWTKVFLAADGTVCFGAQNTGVGPQSTKPGAVPSDGAAADPAPQAITFDATGDGLTFLSAPLEAEIEITGPLAARLHVSSSTEDADLFLILRVFTPDLREVTFMGAIDPHTPVAQGWLRASHRKLDETLSRPWRPSHTHHERQPLEPGEIVPLDIELWPTSIVVPAGHRIALTVRGRDYEFAKSTGARLSNFKNELKGCGPFLHDDPRDRPRATFGGRTTLHLGPRHPSYVLLPVIP